LIEIRCVVEDTALDAEFRAEHGVSFHIRTPAGQILFDTGQSGEVLLHNTGRLGIDLGQIDALAISHGHYDHTGGLAHVLAHTRPMIPLFALPDLFRERYAGENRDSVGIKILRDELAEKADLHLSADPVEMLPGIWTTGEITERPDFEGRGVTHMIHEDGVWKPDPYRDDMSLVVEAEDGLIVLLGCGHAGLLNILRKVQRVFPQQAIIAVIGGTHLGGATDDMLRRAVHELRVTYDSPRLYPNHCTGNKAFATLAEAFGDTAQPCPAGTVLTF
jgi:7,8-dihydropterin-6-yl-methyl-4-(beta-D-ribofuranosyl)aminobenzene 5'-phosphate synthase